MNGVTSANLVSVIQLYRAIREAYDKPIYCEHGAHQWDTDRHWGSSQWYMKLVCPNCGWATGVFAVCDPWKRYVTGGGKVICFQGCDESAPGVDWLQMVEPMRKE